MKLIQCIIQPYKLEEVVDALQSVAPGMTVSEAKGHGHQKGHPMLYRGREYDVSLVPKMMIEIAADDNKVDDIVKVVIHNIRSEEHTSELQSLRHLVCRLLLEKKKKDQQER